MSALRRVGGVLEVRVFNPTARSHGDSLPGRSGWLVDLRGYPSRPFEGSFALRPFGIATARLRDRLSRRATGGGEQALADRRAAPRGRADTSDEPLPAHVASAVGGGTGAVGLVAGGGRTTTAAPGPGPSSSRGRSGLVVNSSGASAAARSGTRRDMRTVPGFPMLTIRWARFTVRPK